MHSSLYFYFLREMLQFVTRIYKDLQILLLDKLNLNGEFGFVCQALGLPSKTNDLRQVT